MSGRLPRRNRTANSAKYNPVMMLASSEHRQISHQIEPWNETNVGEVTGVTGAGVTGPASGEKPFGSQGQPRAVT